MGCSVLSAHSVTRATSTPTPNTLNTGATCRNWTVLEMEAVPRGLGSRVLLFSLFRRPDLLISCRLQHRGYEGDRMYLKVFIFS